MRRNKGCSTVYAARLLPRRKMLRLVWLSRLNINCLLMVLLLYNFVSDIRVELKEWYFEQLIRLEKHNVNAILVM